MPTIVVDGEEESILDESEQTMKPKDVAVQQQRVQAWHPILDPEWMIYSFLILAVIMIPVGTLPLVRVVVAGPDDALTHCFYQVSVWKPFRTMWWN